MLGGIAAFERDLILQRTNGGRMRAAEGTRFGRRPKLTKHQAREALKRVAAGETPREIALSYNVDHSTIVARGDLQRRPRWRGAFANERKDHPYYELVEDTLHPEFDYRYFVIKDTAGQVCAIQPFFLLDLICWSERAPGFAYSSTPFAGCGHA